MAKTAEGDMVEEKIWVITYSFNAREATKDNVEECEINIGGIYLQAKFD